MCSYPNRTLLHDISLLNKPNQLSQPAVDFDAYPKPINILPGIWTDEAEFVWGHSYDGP
jgi:hypothetical protein